MCELGPGSIRVPGRAVTLVVGPGLLEIHREKVQPRMCFVLFSMNHPKVGTTYYLDGFWFLMEHLSINSTIYGNHHIPSGND